MSPMNRRDTPVIPLDTHNVLDYVGGAALIFSPYVFGFADINSARNLFLVLGFGLIAYSLLTNYRYAVLRIIPLGVHMTLDVIAGIALILGQYVFGYSAFLTGFQSAWHYILGVALFALVALTQPKSERKVVGRTDEESNIGEAA